MIGRYLDLSEAEREGASPAARLYEQPLVAWHDAPNSKLRARDGLRAALDLCRIYVSRRSTKPRRPRPKAATP